MNAIVIAECHWHFWEVVHFSFSKLCHWNFIFPFFLFMSTFFKISAERKCFSCYTAQIGSVHSCIFSSWQNNSLRKPTNRRSPNKLLLVWKRFQGVSCLLHSGERTARTTRWNRYYMKCWSKRVRRWAQSQKMGSSLQKELVCHW